VTGRGSLLELQNVTAGYDGTAVLRGLSFSAPPGSLLALLGPSGCGKTTVLKVIAGLLAPLEGAILFDGVVVTGVAAERREAAMVFQKPLLFPHLDVARNVGFGLRMRRIDRATVEQRVTEALDLVQMAGFSRRRSTELSGGQEQRVSLARALVTNPRVLLLDEPFSALDERLRGEMRALVRGVQRRLGITTIFVTHDQAEAAQVSDQIVLLLDGVVEQVGPIRAFYEAPRTPECANFFGWQHWTTPAGVRVFFRPEHGRLTSPDESQGGGELRTGVIIKETADAGTHLICRMEDGTGSAMEVHLSPALPQRPSPGERAELTVPERLAVVFPAGVKESFK